MNAIPEAIGHEVLYHVVDNVAVVALNRPAKRNAVNVAITEALAWVRCEVDRDPAVRVAILTSSTTTCFCAGADLAEVAAGRADQLVTPEGGFAGFVDAAYAKPWIAAVSGAAVGGGTELALACDMIVASEDAVFGLPEVKRGLMAGGGGVSKLPRVIPRAIALELIATGALLPAARAFALGMVNRITPPENLQAEARVLAAEIAANAPVAVRESLGIARQAHNLDGPALRAHMDVALAHILASADAHEGAAAFIEKRAPRWTGG